MGLAKRMAYRTIGIGPAKHAAKHRLTSGWEFSFFGCRAFRSCRSKPSRTATAVRRRLRPQCTTRTGLSRSRASLPRISIAALMEPGGVVPARRLEEGQGDDPCTTPRMNNEQPKKGEVHRVALKQLWKELPISERNEIGQLLAADDDSKDRFLQSQRRDPMNSHKGNLVRRRDETLNGGRLRHPE